MIAVAPATKEQHSEASAVGTFMQGCENIPEANLGPCSSIKIEGFQLEQLNGVYTKDLTKVVQGRSVYMNTNSAFFAYWCEKLAEWRFSIPEYVEMIQQGSCRGWAVGMSIAFPAAEEFYEMVDNRWYAVSVRKEC